MPRYHLQVKWNRCFGYAACGYTYDDLHKAISMAQTLENIGDGAAVKGTRILDSVGTVVWPRRLKRKPLHQHQHLK